MKILLPPLCGVASAGLTLFTMRFLIGCHSLVASGGLLRFERVGSVLRRMGHELAFCVQTADREFDSAHTVLDFAAAAAMAWDAVLIPGAGFPDSTIADFTAFQAPQFGLRVQMILNDQHVRARFLAVNAAFAPQLVVFNNLHWPAGSYREFAASQFHHLIGAVDTGLFQPSVAPTVRSGSFVVGAQAAKHPEALLAALPLLPAACEIRFFGFDRTDAIVRYGPDPRVSQTGPLFGAALSNYYHDIDVMISTEEHAGWANVVAEAMASGTPVITTSAGTLSIATDGDTALIIDQPTPQTIAQNVTRLHQDAALRGRLSTRARAHIQAFDWQGYTDRLVALIGNFDGSRHYVHAPELGLFGKATMSERLEGLQPLLERAADFRDVLDVGAAEGVLAHHLLQSGADRVDAWEIDQDRVTTGQRLFGATPGFALKAADLTSVDAWRSIRECAPAQGYDLVLYLGVHQHLPEPHAQYALVTLLSLSRGWFAIRTPRENFVGDRIDQTIMASGFVPIFEHQPDITSFAGPVHFYQRAQ